MVDYYHDNKFIGIRHHGDAECILYAIIVLLYWRLQVHLICLQVATPLY